ncbi:MAG TPA: three-Cys-motif partner protein TcmP [Acidobacteriaceae bacterium]|jgi:three-Cys-motif partner protein|nr:three-Cys-motif partner protein TcmP [Acidobacteriaceae bacterium]
MTQQEMFGGPWTQQKLEILSKYLSAYRRIFDRNPKARYFDVSYVDAFAGTGVIPRPELGGTLADFIPEIEKAEEEFRKGSARRALEVDPPFHHYVFIEKDRAKCGELSAVTGEFPTKDIRIVNSDANPALLRWCNEMNSQRERAVVFLDPFGASVEWSVIEAIAKTKAVDLWFLFPYGAVNRMLTSGRKPPASWSERLTRVFGTGEWEEQFYSSTRYLSLLDPDQEVELVRKTAGKDQIIQFFIDRLKTVFVDVATPGLLFNSKTLIFVLLFAAGNEKGAGAGIKIANHLLEGLTRP